MSIEHPLAFRVYPDSENYRRFRVTSDFESVKGFGLGVPLNASEVERIQMEPITLQQEIEEDIEEENIGTAERRFKAGFADCIFASYFPGLLLSEKCFDALQSILHTCGQTFPLKIGSQNLHLFNCTKSVEAVKESESEVRLVKGQPAEYTKLVWEHDRIPKQGLFRIMWPERYRYAPIGKPYPPPRPIVATRDFVKTVSDHQLTGFQFAELG